MKVATISTKAWRAALVSTGLGAVAIAAGLLAGKLLEMSNIFDDGEEDVEDHTKALDKNKTAVEKLDKAIGKWGMEKAQKNYLSLEQS